jgi:hypothetical protein
MFILRRGRIGLGDLNPHVKFYFQFIHTNRRQAKIPHNMRNAIPHQTIEWYYLPLILVRLPKNRYCP